MRKKLYSLICIIAVATVLAGCDSDTIYHQYRHTPLAGWKKNDTLFFNTAPMADAWDCKEEIGLRISNEYPFKSVTLIVEQRILPKNVIKRDTVNCNLTNNKGTIQGQGFTCFQYLIPFTKITLDKGDSLSINVRHGMRREILSGIEDIGIKISRSRP